MIIFFSNHQASVVDLHIFTVRFTLNIGFLKQFSLQGEAVKCLILVKLPVFISFELIKHCDIWST